jgi:hypothetical protein
MCSFSVVPAAADIADASLEIIINVRNANNIISITEAIGFIFFG